MYHSRFTTKRKIKFFSDSVLWYFYYMTPPHVAKNIYNIFVT